MSHEAVSRCIPLLVILGSLGGCGNLNTAYRSESENGVKVFAVDIKQRMAWVRTNSDGTYAAVCSEPPPDALTAAAFSGSADLTAADQAKIAASLSSSESATYVGSRTPGVQILRDWNSTLCMLQLSDTPDHRVRDEFFTMFKRNQASTVGILAIERLTQQLPAPAFKVTTSGSGTVTVSTEVKDQAGKVSQPPDKSASQADDSGARKPGADASAPEAAASAVSAPSGAVAKKVASAPTLTLVSTTAPPTERPLVAAALGAKKNEKRTAPAATSQASAATVAEAEPPKKAVEQSLGDSRGKTDVQAISDRVYDIVRLVVVDAFGAENCDSAFSAADGGGTVAMTGATNAPLPMRYLFCLAREVATCIKNGGDRDTCKGIAVETAASKGETAAAQGEIVRQSSSALGFKPKNTSIPFDGLRFGVFRCDSTPPIATQKMIQSLVDAGVAKTLIRDRGAFTRKELAAKGFTLSSAAEVLYDTDISAEASGSDTLRELANSTLRSLGAPGATQRSANTKDKTSLYLSVALCT